MYFSSWIFKLPILKNYDAITLWRWVFFRLPQSEVPPSTIKHEKIHLDQIAVIGVFRFYVSYLLYFFAGVLRFWSWNDAYMNIPFEIEAYDKQNL